MPVRHTVEDEVEVENLATDQAVTTSAVDMTEFDVRDFEPGSRFLLILDASGNDAGNTGGTWSVGESATTGGAVTAATTSGSLAATGAAGAGVVVSRVVSLLPNPAKPFVTVKLTNEDADTDLDVTANLVVLPRGLL